MVAAWFGKTVEWRTLLSWSKMKVPLASNPLGLRTPRYLASWRLLSLRIGMQKSVGSWLIERMLSLVTPTSWHPRLFRRST